MKPQAPTVAEMEKLAKKYECQAVMILSIRQDGTIDLGAYGSTKRKCAALTKWVKDFGDNTISRIPFSTVFGWGNGGKRWKVPPEEFEKLSPNGKRYHAMFEAIMDGKIDATGKPIAKGEEKI